MLFTPDERRALLTVGGLLTLGLCVRVLAPGPPPPEGGGDSLLVVLAMKTMEVESSSAPPPPGLIEEGKVRINEAGLSDLVSLPRIGPALAQRIIDDRARNGPFRSVDDLARVKGIGPKMVRQLAPFVSCRLAVEADCTANVQNAVLPAPPP